MKRFYAFITAIILCLVGISVASCSVALRANPTPNSQIVVSSDGRIYYDYDYYGYYPYIYYNRYNGRYHIDYYDYYYRYPWRSNIYINIPHHHHKDIHHHKPAPKPRYTPSHTPGPGRRHDGPAVTPKPANGKPAVNPSTRPHRSEPTYRSTPTNNNHHSASPSNGNVYRSTGSSNASSSRISTSRGSNTNNSHSTTGYSRGTSSSGGRGGRR